MKTLSIAALIFSCLVTGFVIGNSSFFNSDLELQMQIHGLGYNQGINSEQISNSPQQRDSIYKIDSAEMYKILTD